MDNLFGTRLQDVAEHAVRDRTRLARAHTHDFENMILIRYGCRGTALFALRTFRFRNRRSQTDGNIVGEMLTPNRDNHRVPHRAVVINGNVGFSATDIHEHDTEFFFILR